MIQLIQTLDIYDVQPYDKFDKKYNGRDKVNPANTMFKDRVLQVAGTFNTPNDGVVFYKDSVTNNTTWKVSLA